MNRRHAAEIRRGILLARAGARRERVAPTLTPFGFRGAGPMPLWGVAYHHEFRKHVHPPQAPSIILNPKV